MAYSISMNIHILFSTSIVLLSLIIVGTILCLPLYKWNLRSLVRSSLFTKILWWIPIYAILVALLFIGARFAAVLVLVLIGLSLYEFQKNIRGKHKPVAYIYLSFFIIATTSIFFLFALFSHSLSVQLALVICFASILSDVFAFFFGNYLSKHPLPRWINPNKSWEGVAGQIIGAFAGASLLGLVTGIHAPWLLVLIIGAASAFGDLFNSVAKRQLGIKDWGKTIPGHGGVLDRMSSLSTAFFASFVVFLISILSVRF